MLRISGKELGALAMPSFCPRCFHIKMAVGARYALAHARSPGFGTCL